MSPEETRPRPLTTSELIRQRLFFQFDIKVPKECDSAINEELTGLVPIEDVLPLLDALKKAEGYVFHLCQPNYGEMWDKFEVEVMQKLRDFRAKYPEVKK